MKLNEKIFYCRKKAGLSQEALAEELGVSRQAVSKWETGDAVPEIGKLVSLAKTFDVTTDWLLSEEEPEEEPEFKTNYYKESVEWKADDSTGTERFEKVADNWMDAVPGVLGKLVRRFGWIAGVYIAISGGGLAGIGMIAKVIVNSMVNGFNNAANSMMSGFGGFGGNAVTFYDENGNQLSASESAKLAEIFNSTGNIEGIYSFGGDMFSSGMDAMNGMIQNNPVSILATFMIIIGLIMLVAGIIFAVIWYKKSSEQN